MPWLSPGKIDQGLFNHIFPFRSLGPAPAPARRTHAAATARLCPPSRCLDDDLLLRRRDIFQVAPEFAPNITRHLVEIDEVYEECMRVYSASETLQYVMDIDIIFCACVNKRPEGEGARWDPKQIARVLPSRTFRPA
jgi:hypothetical protein